METATNHLTFEALAILPEEKDTPPSEGHDFMEIWFKPQISELVMQKTSGRWILNEAKNIDGEILHPL